jgi:CRP-like cAMP-binding protein
VTITACLRTQRFFCGQTVFNDGGCGDCLYLVQSGRLDVQVTGTERQTANRVLQAGVRDGIVALGRGTIVVLDRAVLAATLGHRN